MQVVQSRYYLAKDFLQHCLLNKGLLVEGFLYHYGDVLELYLLHGDAEVPIYLIVKALFITY